MAIMCSRCDKVFIRNSHLERHNNRKIKCDKKLMCNKCGKTFSQIGNLNRHLNKKISCVDTREIYELKIKLAELKNKGKEIDNDTESIKLKQMKKTTNYTNIHIGNTTNIINIHCGINYTMDEINNMIISGDINASLSNFIKLHFNNDEFPMNKCIKFINNNIFINLNGKIVTFEDARKDFNEKINQQIECIINNFIKYTDEEMDQNGMLQKKEYISCEKIYTLEKIDPYIKNNRYKGAVKKAIKIGMN
jgi:uncharacterized C2H2 Zn-finger protein